MAKWVYLFEEGSADMRNLLGGKGANLAEMTRLGLPIPQGFTVTTEACTDYYNQGKKISEEIDLTGRDKMPIISNYYRYMGLLRTYGAAFQSVGVRRRRQTGGRGGGGGRAEGTQI